MSCRIRFYEDEGEIVRWHRNDLPQLEPVGHSVAYELVYIAHAPAGISLPEIYVEGGIGCRRMCPAPHERPVEE